MGKEAGPRQRRKAERPSEILDAAFEVFSTAGFAATRLEDVAARAGITKGTIYIYFSSKEDLFQATLAEMIRPAVDHIKTVSAAPRGPAMAILRAHLHVVADQLIADRRGRQVVRMLMAEGSRFPRLIDRWHADIIEPSLAGLRSIIAYGIARGEFKETSIYKFPEMIMAPIMLANNWSIIFADRYPIDIPRFIDAAMDVLSQGLTTTANPQEHDTPT